MTTRQLVADIGGTNARFSLFDPVQQSLGDTAILTAADFPDITAAVQHYLRQAGSPRLDEACFAVACPAKDDAIVFTNSPWHFSRSALAERLGLARLLTLNDFEALALGVPHLAPRQLAVLRDGEAESDAPRAVVGPGTGLGVSGLLPVGVGRHGRHWIALSGEGGHVSFAPTNDTEAALLSFLTRSRDRASIERVLCGDGLVNLYEFFAERDGRPGLRPQPAQVTSMALEQSDPAAVLALQQFCATLGDVAGDLALTLGARGGVYIGGGIVPRVLEFVRRSEFLTRFQAKGRMARILAPIPIHVILDSAAALLGAAAALDKE